METALFPDRLADKRTNEELFEALLSKTYENTELKADLKIIKDCLIAILLKTGMMNTDGTMREGINMKAIMEIAMKATMQPAKMKDEFAFLSALMPLAAKYNHL